VGAGTLLDASGGPPVRVAVLEWVLDGLLNCRCGHFVKKASLVRE
jgi:hypothetical protein